MKKGIFKVSVILAIILSMTMSNFIAVGSGLISYAQDAITTNNQNVEFKAYFKNEQGNEVQTLERKISDKENYLYLQVNVKKEGSFNGQIKLTDSNFNIKKSDSSFVNKIENNTIYLNQVNVGSTDEIKVEIEPIDSENIEIGLLNKSSKVEITGIYRDVTQKDIKVEAQREVTLALAENNTANEVIHQLDIISNKLVKIQGEDKKMVQFSYQVGLKDNNYPIKEINSKITVPGINGNNPQIEKVAYLNNMSKIDYEIKQNEINIKLENEATSWKIEGNENIVITCIYDKDAQIENTKITTQETIILYNNKKLETQGEATIGQEQLDNTIEVNIKNKKDKLYKGKINSGIEKQYSTTTELKINFAKTIENIDLTEQSSNYVSGETIQPANVTYKQTVIKKEQLEKIFGQSGEITIYDQNGILITTVNANIADQDGNIIINYDQRDVTGLNIKTSKPEHEGTLEFTHIKAIKENAPIANEINELKNKVTAIYNGIEGAKEIEPSIHLENSKSKAKLLTDKDSLSTVISNNIEMKVVLQTNSEKYELFKNPEIVLQLPEQIENITINSADLLYDNELSIKDYKVEGKLIHIYLEGEQTNYKDKVVEGTTIVINATIDVNRKVASKDEAINMNITNEKGTAVNIQKPIKIAAPTELTAIQSIEKLGVETIGQEENKEVMMQKATGEQQLQTDIEIINNKEEAIQNVKILGEFPTDHGNNNMGIALTKGIELQGVENAKVYYSENDKATEDIENSENAWTTNLGDLRNASKYLILADKIEGQSSIEGAYQYTVPANLEYNKTAETSYTVKSTSSNTNVESLEKSTNIELQTGVGPKIDTKLTANIGGSKITGAVKNGEVIEFKVEVSNTGTQDLTNIQVKGTVPEGTTLVRPVDNYEYSGAYYYDELENRVFEGTIESLKIGEVKTLSYEVKVNGNTEAGTTLSTKSQVLYGDAKKENEISDIKTTKGNLAVSVKRVTDRKCDIYAGGVIRYYAIIENISNQKQDDVMVQTNLPDNAEVGNVTLISGMGKQKITNITEFDQETKETAIDVESTSNDDNITTKDLEYENEMNIGAINPGESKVLEYYVQINKTTEQNKTLDFSVIAKNGEKEYKSNTWKENVKDFEVSISMKSNTESQYVKSGDTIEYTIEVENKSDEPANSLNILDEIPKQLTITKLAVNNQEIEMDNDGALEFALTTPAKSKDTVTITTTVDYSENREQAEAITNVATAEVLGEKVATTSEINHIIQAEEDEDGNGNNDVVEESKNDNQGENVQEGDKVLTGIAWFDENANGQKDEGEKLLNNIKVKLLNIDTNSYVKEATTNENGVYVIDKIPNGKYIAVFEYDNTKYSLTKYKASGVSDAQNSNAILNDLTINNETKKLASTDIIDLNNGNISGINIGLIERKNFDLSLNKYVNRVLIQTSKGTTVKQYNNETIAKAELDAKQINGATVVIEYKIAVTNNGEIDGYVKKIADYVPSDLKFSSELNKEWYQTGNTLYTNSLANEKIKSGETKVVTLTLSKAMTENNTGLVVNTAEIAESYNELGIEDGNSKPGNRAKEENDFGEAQVLLSIRTGATVYITLITVGIIALTATAVIIIRRKKSEEGGE